MEKIKTVFSGISNVIFGLLLGIILIVLALFLFGIKPYITMSGSMEPDIRTGSVCFVNTRAKYNDVQKGDVVAFQTSMGSLATHRVISITEEGLETKGDANDVSDGISTTPENFCGKTLFSIPYVGYGLASLKQPQNIAIVIVVIAAIVLLGAVDDSEAKRAQRKKQKSDKNV